MLSKVKKTVSIVLSVLIVLSVVSFVPISVGATTYNFLFPVQDGKIAYYYGYSASYGGTHDGLDIHSTGKDTIYAACDGVVEATANSCPHVDYYPNKCKHYNTYGNYIRIKNSDGTKSYYGHLKLNSLLVATGQSVKKGQAIASMGSSGYSSGKHLHFEVRLSNGSTKVNVNPTSNGGSVNYSYSGYGIHTHSYTTFVEYQSAHPHYAVYKCSCGATQVNKNKTQYSTSCSTCINSLGAAQTISDGEYLIALNANQNYCLAVDGDKTSAEANVQLWNNVKDNNVTSVVKVKHEGNGFYSLIFKNSGKALDVKNYGKANGTNVLQYYPTSNSNQRWVIKPTGDNKSFYIVSKCDGLYLDVYNGTAANGTNVQMYKGNGSAAQKWRFIASGLSTGQTLSDGKYKIKSYSGDNLALDVKGGTGENQAVMQLYNRPLKDMSEFNVKYLGNGYYHIEYTKTNRRLDVKGNYAYKGVPIQLYDQNTYSAQQWIIKYAGDGYYNIVSKGTGMYLDNAGAKTTNGNAVQGWLGNGAIAQKWRFIPASTTKSGSFNGHRYEYYRGKTNWTQAFKQCEKLGGHLVTINSKEENDYLVSLTNGYTGRIWTGGTTYYTSNWHWITSGAYEYENFKAGEPSSDEECYIDMYVSGDYAGQWNDEKVNNANVEGFVCEYDDTASGKDYQPAFSESYNNHYYEFYNDNIDWNTAKSFCEAKGGHLLTIQNSAENTFITSKISGLSRNEVWLGYSDIELEGSWKSVDGTAFSYSTWLTGNPDNNMGIEDCLVITGEGKWGDLKTFNNINRSIGFVCEYDEPKPTESTTVAESETTEPVEIPTTTEAVTTEPVVNTETTTPVEVETSEPLTDNPTVLVKEVKGKSGEEVEVPVEISNNTGIIALTLDVTYDSSALKLTGVKDGGLLGTDIHKPEFTSPYTLSWANDNAQTDFNENGILATLCFEIKDTAKAGKYPISLSYDYDNYGTYNKDAQKVKLTLKNGSIEVDKIVYGDVNGDGTVNNLDRLYLTRYLANWEDYKNINKNNADVDCNGTVNNLDRLILTRYLANWSDYKILPYKK